MKDGEYTLEGWLTDTPDPTRLLTEKVKIKFRAMDLGMTSEEASETGHIEERNEHKSGMQLSKHIRDAAKKTTIHDVLASMLQANGPRSSTECSWQASIQVA